MEKTLNLVLTELKALREGQDILKSDVNSLRKGQDTLSEGQDMLKSDVNSLREGQERIEKKLDSVVEQTADLTEFSNSTHQNFSDIKDTLKFISHKETENEKDIFLLKDKISRPK